jgi:hypothetical protein
MEGDYRKKNREFVLNLAKKDKKLHDIIDDFPRLCAYVASRLELVTPLQGPENLPHGSPSYCSKLEDYQLAKISWMLDSLEMDAEFKRKIGEKLEEDIKDKESAYGGFVVFGESSLALRLVPSKPHPPGAYSGKNNYSNYCYDPVEASLLPEALFMFHFHAFNEENSKFASPSNSDLKEAERRNADCLVFTKIMGNRFNVDFYFVSRDASNRPFNIILDLGVYEY